MSPHNTGRVTGRFSTGSIARLGFSLALEAEYNQRRADTTQRDIAKAAGVHEVWLSGLLNGKERFVTSGNWRVMKLVAWLGFTEHTGFAESPFHDSSDS
jgi:hypothetical protein